MNPEPPQEVIDFGRLGAALRRGWALVAACGAGGLLTAAVLTARTPRVWEADFQIVLAENQASTGLGSLLNQGGGLGALLGAAGISPGNNVSSQETELKILLSPSVLLPVYTYVKGRLPASKSQSLSFSDWADSVHAKAAKGTAVLDVSYAGTDPALVLAASRRLAEAYQNYSGRKRQRSLQALITYLNDQVNSYRPRSEASRARAEAFADRHTLTNADATSASGAGPVALGADGGLGSLLSGLNNAVGGNASGSLKAQQDELNKRIFELKFQLARVRQAGDREPIQVSSSGGSSLLASLSGGAGASNAALLELDRLIAERRSRFEDNDPTVANLQRQRRVLIGVINRQLAQEIASAIRLSESQLAALQRPAGVIETFQKLSNAANRDATILQNLETNLEQQKLELARDAQPWELISAPTLRTRPVSPRPSQNLGLGLLAGLLSGGAAAVLRERRSGIVHHTDTLLEVLPYPLLGTLNSAHAERWRGLLELLAHGPLQGCPQVALIPVGNLGKRAQPLQAALQAVLQQNDPAAQVLLSHDLLQASRCQAQLLVASLGTAHKDTLSQLQQDLQLQGKPVAGLLLLSAPQAGDDA